MQTRTGGIKARETNKRNHGEDFYQKIGAMGGKTPGKPKGFAANRALAAIAGKKGGTISRRNKPMAYSYSISAEEAAQRHTDLSYPLTSPNKFNKLSNIFRRKRDV